MIVRLGVRLASPALLLACSIGVAGAAPQPAPAPRQPAAVTGATVRTVAGDGNAGYRDGNALTARFMMPAAVAYDRAGRLFIADEGAQRIRMLANGRVTTVAGSGDQIELGQYVKGGFRDGAALQAQFDHPAGIVVAPDGTLYVADTFNHCVRMVKNGVVSTYAGSAESPGTADGPLATARFEFPRGLALDAEGDLLVADSGVGVREIDRAGNVATLPDAGDNKEFLGVAAWGSGPSRVVVAIDNSGAWHRFLPGKPGEPFRSAEDVVAPQMGGVVSLTAKTVLVTDSRVNVVRELLLPSSPFIGSTVAGVVAGTALEDWGNSAGFADGPVDRAKFFAPLGLAVHGRDLAIADAGNRRIRLMPVPDVRDPATPGSQELAPDPAHYRILYAGQSGAYFATDWQTSIPGLVERELVERRAELRFRKPPRVSSIRMDGAGLRAIDDYVETYASDGQFDLVVLSIGPDTFEPALLQQLAAKLRAAKTDLFVIIMPFAKAVVVEDAVYKRPTAERVSDYSAEERYELRTIETAKTTGLHIQVAYPDVMRYEQGDRRLPISIPSDVHPSYGGRVLQAHEIVDGLTRWHPWTSR